MSEPPYRDPDFDPDFDEERPAPPSARRSAASRPTPLGTAVIGGLVGAVLMAVLLMFIGGNPFSDVNEVHYQQFTVATVSEEGDRICWSREPDRRDAPLDCAILALDPRVAVPQEGDEIMAGIVTLRTPGGVEIQQLVFAGPPSGEAPVTETASPAPGSDATEDAADEAGTPTAPSS